MCRRLVPQMATDQLPMTISSPPVVSQTENPPVLSLSVAEGQPAEAVSSSAASTRLYYIDKLRFWLTVLVVLHHCFVVVRIGWIPFHEFWQIDYATNIIATMFLTGNQAYFMGLFFFLAGLVTGPSLKRKGSFLFIKDRFLRLMIPYILYDYFFFQLLFCFVEATWWGPQQGWTESVSDVWIYYYDNYSSLNGTHMWFTLLLFVFNLIMVILLSVFKSWESFVFTKRSVETISTRSMIFILIATSSVLVLLNFLPRLAMSDGYIWVYVWGNCAFIMQYCVAFTAGIVANSFRFLDHLNKTHLFITLGSSLFFYGSFQVFQTYLFDFFRNTIGFYAQIFFITLFEQFYAVFWSYSLLVLFKEYKNEEPSRTFSTLIGAAYAAYIVQQYIIVPLAVGLAYASIHPLLVILILCVVSPFPALLGGLVSCSRRFQAQALFSDLLLEHTSDLTSRRQAAVRLKQAIACTCTSR